MYENFNFIQEVNIMVIIAASDVEYLSVYYILYGTFLWF